MAVTQILLVAATVVAAASAAPQGRLANTYLPPPPSPPPDTYLPPSTPSPEYLPPPSGEYLPPPSGEYLPPPSGEYLPPPSGKYLPPPADGRGQEQSLSIADLPVDNSLSEEDVPAAGPSAEESAGASAGQGAEQGAGQSEGQGGRGQYDDGKYKPGQYNSGKYDPNASKFNGDDGQYHPEKIEFPAIEDFDFAYAVKDKESGNDYALKETNKGGAYKVLLPDGRTQVVQFVIDSRGIYRSKITYLQPDGSQ